MTNKVLDFFSGEEKYGMGKPNPRVVELVKEVLERAEAGEIVGVAIAAEHCDNATSDRSAGEASRSLVGRLFSLATELTVRLNGF